MKLIDNLMEYGEGIILLITSVAIWSFVFWKMAQ